MRHHKKPPESMRGGGTPKQAGGLWASWHTDNEMKQRKQNQQQPLPISERRDRAQKAKPTH